MTAQAYAAISNFGREVEINLAVVEYDGRGEVAAIGQPTEIIFTTETVPEGVSFPKPPTLRLRHDMAQALYESLYRLYGPASLPSDPALKEALEIERKRVDRLIDVALDG